MHVVDGQEMAAAYALLSKGGAAWLANSYKGGWGYLIWHASQESLQALHGDSLICQLLY